MDKIKNMRAFQDGRRLVIVIEDADDAMLSLVRAMLSGNIPAVQHIAPPPPMEPPKADIQNMTELLPDPIGTTPKFIQKNIGQTSFDAGDKLAEQSSNHICLREDGPKHSFVDSKEFGIDFDIGHASYFETRDFLLSQRENTRLKEILYARTKSRDLNFVVNVKSEKELKEIARQLVESCYSKRLK